LSGLEAAGYACGAVVMEHTAERERERRIRRGDTASSCLAAEAHLASWGTPTAGDKGAKDGDDPKGGGTIKERLQKMGVKFEGEEEPMDVNLSDEEFCKACGIKKPEPWEMTAAAYAFTEDKLGKILLPPPKKKPKK
jgi:hypothetical protein